MGAGNVGIFRAHLTIQIEQAANRNTKLLHIGRLMSATGMHAPTLVFVQDGNTALRVRDALTERCAVSVMHPGQSSAERQAQRHAFLSGATTSLVTTALKHELGRTDVRLVVHHDWPTTLEAYHRQIMEGGQDGWPSRAVLLSSPQDVPRERLLAFGRARGCRWRLLQEHLGDDLAFTRCGACDNCQRLDQNTEAVVRQMAEARTEETAHSSTAATQAHQWSAPVEPAGSILNAPVLRQGLAVAVDRHGWGWVRGVDESLVSVDFPDGHRGRFTPGHVHLLSQQALDFAARLLPAQVSALRQHEEDHLGMSLTYGQLLGRDPSTASGRTSPTSLLGPSGSSDSGSDVAWWGAVDDDDGNFCTDASGTGECWRPESSQWHDAFDIAPDRIVDNPNEGTPEP